MKTKKTSVAKKTTVTKKTIITKKPKTVTKSVKAAPVQQVNPVTVRIQTQEGWMRGQMRLRAQKKS